jgi:GT2 family glycosyltransferase
VYNLRECASAVLLYERGLEPKNIVVVDDDETGKVHEYIKQAKLTRVKGAKPFIFARNANRGMWKAFDREPYVILMNDDALLKTKNGFSEMIRQSTLHPEFGIISATTNSTGNPRMQPTGGIGVRKEPTMLCFICVLIRHQVWTTVGALDERYALDYGVEDGDYSYRVRKAGLGLGIYDGCFVDHRALKSTFRPDGMGRSFQQNKQLFEAKWGFPYESQ